MYGGSHINCAGYIGTDEDFSDLIQSPASGDDSDDSWIAVKQKRPNWRENKRRFIKLEDKESEEESGQNYHKANNK